MRSLKESTHLSQQPRDFVSVLERRHPSATVIAIQRPRAVRNLAGARGPSPPHVAPVRLFSQELVERLDENKYRVVHQRCLCLMQGR